jgi:hypothetical protein
MNRSLARFSPWLLVALAACGVDERPLSFTLGARNGGGNGNGTSGSESGAWGGDDAASAGGETAPGHAGGEGPAGSRATAGSPSQTAGSGGASNEGGGDNDAGGSAGSSGSGPDLGGTSGNGGGGTPFESPCGDLNDNRVDDCEETLVKNSRFDSAASDWSAERAIDQRWEAANASGGDKSGALLVSNKNLMDGGGDINTVLGSRQCLRAWMDERFDLGVRAFIKGGQGKGSAELNVLIYAEDNCAGQLIEGRTIATTTAVDGWRTLEGELKLPAAARSMHVRLVAAKPLSQASLDVLFDDVLVSEKK